jgi:biotin transport system substrate-specific component
MLLGSAIIYTCGAVWLAHSLNIAVSTGEENAISLGVAPFLIGDLLKVLLAAASTSTIWQVIKN